MHLVVLNTHPSHFTGDLLGSISGCKLVYAVGSILYVLWSLSSITS
jgi:hypothetical protein